MTSQRKQRNITNARRHRQNGINSRERLEDAKRAVRPAPKPLRRRTPVWIKALLLCVALILLFGIANELAALT